MSQRGGNSSSSSSDMSLEDSGNYYNEQKAASTSSNMVALACLNCHLLVILSKSSPSCPNCNGNHTSPDVKQSIESTFPHYGHSGTQIEGNHRDIEAGSSGFLASLLEAGCECYGYNLCIVGHSLGGAIAAMLGLSINVWAFRSIIHDNEFSSRLSVGAVLRLRAAVIMALAQDSKTDTALIFRLARRFLHVSKYRQGRIQVADTSESHSGVTKVEKPDQRTFGGGNELEDQRYPWRTESDMGNSTTDFDDDDISESSSCNNMPSVYLPDDSVSIFRDSPVLSIDVTARTCDSLSSTTEKYCYAFESRETYKAYLTHREFFKDLVVSPYMFLDHLPWRCHDAMRNLLGSSWSQRSP